MESFNICEMDLCTGCSSCVSVCPKNCIELKEDSYGQLKAFINTKFCIDCKQCINVCPNNNKVELNKTIHCYASVRKDTSKLTRCASGGVGTYIMEHFFNNGYKVFATRLDNDLIPKIIELKNLRDLSKYKGSLYVQSLENNSIKLIEKYLKQDESVLFIGTPCQIAGLKNYLKRDYDKLLCCDLFCHGVVPTKYLQEEIKTLTDKSITDITFRGYNIKRRLYTNIME